MKALSVEQGASLSASSAIEIIWLDDGDTLKLSKKLPFAVFKTSRTTGVPPHWYEAL